MHLPDVAVLFVLFKLHCKLGVHNFHGKHVWHQSFDEKIPSLLFNPMLVFTRDALNGYAHRGSRAQKRKNRTAGAGAFHRAASTTAFLFFSIDNAGERERAREKE